MGRDPINGDPLITAQMWALEGRSVAVATVLQTWGSAPRPCGSHLIIDEAGNFEGSVSGGCVEGEVVVEALEVLKTGKPARLQFGVADETAWRVGLSCGGTIEIYITTLERITPDKIRRLNEGRAERCPVALIFDLVDDSIDLAFEGEAPSGQLAESLARAFATGRSGVAVADPRKRFLCIYRPSAKLVIIGAVHISQALAPMAAISGFDVHIIDPRIAFATPERFPHIAFTADWPSDVLIDEPLDSMTALVALTHDPKIDDDPLVSALKAKCFYVAALGSTTTHSARLKRLAAAGVSNDLLKHIRGPAGLNIRASTPAEIAVAILAEAILALRQSGSSRSVREDATDVW